MPSVRPSGARSWSPAPVAAVVAGLMVVASVVYIRRGTGDAPTSTVAAPVITIAPATATPLAPDPSTTRGDVGPTTVVDGVPMGYAHSPAGAEAAGLGFLRLDEALVGMDDAAASAAKRVIAASGSADSLVRNVVAKLDALRTAYPGGTTRYRIAALATRVSPAGADRVRVEIWHVGVVSPPGAAPYEQWATQRYELVWERDDWRDAGEASTPGPQPVALPRRDSPVPAQLETALAGFGPLGQAR